MDFKHFFVADSGTPAYSFCETVNSTSCLKLGNISDVLWKESVYTTRILRRLGKIEDSFYGPKI